MSAPTTEPAAIDPLLQFFLSGAAVTLLIATLRGLSGFFGARGPRKRVEAIEVLQRVIKAAPDQEVGREVLERQLNRELRSLATAHARVDWISGLWGGLVSHFGAVGKAMTGQVAGLILATGSLVVSVALAIVAIFPSTVGDSAGTAESPLALIAGGAVAAAGALVVMLLARRARREEKSLVLLKDEYEERRRRMLYWARVAEEAAAATEPRVVPESHPSSGDAAEGQGNPAPRSGSPR